MKEEVKTDNTVRILLVVAILLCFVSIITTILFFVITEKIDNLQNELNDLKSTSVSNQDIKNILDSMPSQLVTSADFDKLNEALIRLQKELDETNSDNQDLRDDIDRLQHKLNQLQSKVNSIGIVVGVY